MMIMTAPTTEDILARGYTFIAKADREEGGWVIVYPDLPGAVTQADVWEEIGEMAEDALRTWVEAQLESGRPIPEPTDVPIPEWDWATAGVQLLTTREVAERLNVTPRRVLALATSRGLGRKIGHSVMFHPDEVEALRPGPVGRPARGRHRQTA
jgi:predicted RNase H-like HicB family nuclease